MDKGAMLFGATLFIILAALTSIASPRSGEPDTSGAVAAVLKYHLADFVGMKTIEGKGTSHGPLVLCLASKAPLEIEAIGRDLAGTVIAPVPANTCTSETIEGDFGMFTAITKHYDAMGDEVAYLEVVGVSCPSTRRCIVDIDDFGSGHRYEMRREGRAWLVAGRSERWIV